MALACRRAGRDRASVQLMAVTKTHPPELIVEAFACGIRMFGENRVQEFVEKRPALLAEGLFEGSKPARLHCIGPLQSNKAARAARIFDSVDTVDSVHLAERLDQAARTAGKRLPVLIGIKLSKEPSKHGVTPGTPEMPQLLERMHELGHLEVRGIMTVPPFSEDLEVTRPYFRELCVLRDSLAQRYPALNFDELSMGMSHDFEVAIEEGATLVRVGTAIFGSRSAR